MPQTNENTALISNNDGESSSTTGDNNGDGLTLTARMAYENSNAEASRKYHESRLKSGSGDEQKEDETWHQSEGGLLKPVIFGGLDGILTSFAIVAGAAGGGLSPSVVLVLGFSNIFADALRYVDRFGFFVSCNSSNQKLITKSS
jgi:DNA damage-binding protein 1